LKKIFLTLILSISALFFIGCGSGQTNSEQITEIDGRWMTGDNNIISIHNGNIIYEEIQDDMRIEFNTLGSVTGEKLVQPNDIVVKTIAVTHHVYVTPLTTALADDMTVHQAFGITGWTRDVKKDVTEYMKPIYSELEDSTQIYLLEGALLNWGDPNQIGEDGYPEALNYYDIWTRP